MKIAIFTVLALLSGCAHVGTVDMGNGSYSVTEDSHRDCPGGSRVNAVEDANAFCAKQAATAVVSSFQDLVGVGSCTTSVVFTCTPQR